MPACDGQLLAVLIPDSSQTAPVSATRPASPPPRFTRRALANLLALLFLTLAWGANWPVAKLGVSAMPPLWFRALGTAGGVLVLWCFARLRGIDLTVPRGKRAQLVALAVPNMVLWYALVSIALVTVPAGRAAILGFTMPAWAALFGLFGMGERPDRLSMLSVALSLVATGLLVGGSAMVPGQSVAIGLIVLAAVCWAAGTILLRRWPIQIDTTALTLWMLLTTAVALLLLSALLERSAWVVPDRAGWYAIAYNAVIVVGFGNIAWFALARRLAPVVSGLSTMMIPVVGVFSSMLMVGEVPGGRDWSALILVALALFLSVAPRPRRSTIDR